MTQVHLELGVGGLPADLHVADSHVERVVMTQARPAFGAVLDDMADLIAGLGLPQMMVPVLSLSEVRALDAKQLHVAALNRVCHALGAECTAVFTLETEQPEGTVHVRVFAPLVGVPEDPATGSANGALGAYLVHHKAVPITEPTTRILSEQGVELGRPSTLHVAVDSVDGDITTVRVGERGHR